MRLSYFRLLLLIIYVSLISGSCQDNQQNIIVVTGDAQDVQSLNTLIDSRSLKIGIINTARPGKPARILTSEFMSAFSPEVSYDGKSMIFAGRKNETSPWQIWEMNLNNSKVRNISPCHENCMYPSYLPGSQVVFSKMLVNDSLKSQLSLFRCNTDGTGLERITFTPATWFASSVLADGRILAKCSQPDGKPEFMVLRPDGTKAELFCKPQLELGGSRAGETQEGNILFTGKKQDGSVSEIITVSYNNPFQGTSVLTSGMTGDFLSVHTAPGRTLVCYRDLPGEKYRLYEFDYNDGLGNVLHGSDEYDIVEAVLKGEKPKPRKLPSEVDKLVKTGLLLCQDVSFPDGKKITKIEVAGIDSSHGTILPEADGSFYLKVISDMPFRLRTYDEKGEMVNECNWMSLRPNERRGCTGCHEDPQVVPENRIPLAVKKTPVIIPVTLNKIEEKIIELE